MEIDKVHEPNYSKIYSIDPKMDWEKLAEVMSAEMMEIDDTTFPEKVVPQWAQPIFSFLKEKILPDHELWPGR